jgi:hypothetical protein
MVTLDFVQAGKFWVKNERMALFGDPQEVQLILYMKIYIRRRMHFFSTDSGVTIITVG